MPKQFFATWSTQRQTASMDVAAAERDEFILRDGRRVYDFVSTSFQASFGHSCEAIRSRIREQLDRMSIASPKAVFTLKNEVSQQLLELLDRQGDRGPGRLFYTVSGAESVENALKIARHYTGRKLVLARRRSYHGATLGAMSVSGDWRSADHLRFDEGTIRIPEPHDDPQGAMTRDIVMHAGPEQVAAIIVEPISGVNGVIIPDISWWNAIEQLCCEFGILLVADEVLCGFGRTGLDFAVQHWRVQPDLICMSKAISGGYVPFGALWVSRQIAEHYDDRVLACGLTSYAHPLGLAALQGVLQLLGDARFCEQKIALERRFSQCLSQLSSLPHVAGIRHRGLLAAIDFHSQAPSWQTCLDRGVYLFSKGQMIVLAPPFVSTGDRLETAMAALAAAVEKPGP